jgi:NADP-dependent 3-hydroxy acid dehydrogenase YdfG
MNLGLGGKTALITGDAGGIGSGVCEVFAREGTHVSIIQQYAGSVFKWSHRLPVRWQSD